MSRKTRTPPPGHAFRVARGKPLTVADVAAMLGVSDSHVVALDAAIPHTRVNRGGRKCRRYTAADVATFRARNRVGDAPTEQE